MLIAWWIFALGIATIAGICSNTNEADNPDEGDDKTLPHPVRFPGEPESHYKERVRVWQMCETARARLALGRRRDRYYAVMRERLNSMFPPEFQDQDIEDVPVTLAETEPRDPEARAEYEKEKAELQHKHSIERMKLSQEFEKFKQETRVLLKRIREQEMTKRAGIQANATAEERGLLRDQDHAEEKHVRTENELRKEVELLKSLQENKEASLSERQRHREEMTQLRAELRSVIAAHTAMKADIFRAHRNLRDGVMKNVRDSRLQTEVLEILKEAEARIAKGAAAGRGDAAELDRKMSLARSLEELIASRVSDGTVSAEQAGLFRTFIDKIVSGDNGADSNDEGGEQV